MDKKSSLVLDTLKQLEIHTHIYLKKIVPIMGELDSGGDNIVDEIMYCIGYGFYEPDNDDYSNMEKEILEWLRAKTLEMVEDTEKIVKELPKFKESIEKEGIEGIEKHKKSYPFFVEIWCGDTYNNKEEDEGLKTLLDEIKENSKNATEDILVNLAVKQFKKK